MNWLNTKYILWTGVLSILLSISGPVSATYRTDTIINTYKADSLRFIIKADSIIAFQTGDSLFTIIKADSVLPAASKKVKHTRYDKRVQPFSAEIGNESFLPTLRYSLPATWDYFLLVRDGITENIINGRLIYCLDLSRSILQKRLK